MTLRLYNSKHLNISYITIPLMPGNGQYREENKMSTPCYTEGVCKADCPRFLDDCDGNPELMEIAKDLPNDIPHYPGMYEVIRT